LAVRGRPFKKGNKFGRGRPKMPKELLELKAYTKAEIEDRMVRFLAKSQSEIKEMIKDPNTQMIDLLIATLMAKGVQNGCPQRIDFIMTRLCGPPPKDVTPTEGTQPNKVGVAYVPKSKRDK